MGFGSRQVRSELLAAGGVGATEHRGVDFQHQVHLLQVKQVDTARHVVIDQRVALQHVAQHLVGERVARFGEVAAELGEMRLHLAQGVLDGVEIQAGRRWHRLSLIAVLG